MYGIVKNFALLNVSIKGIDEVGGVAGFSQGIIQNCYVTGSVVGANNVGGVVGWNADRTIENCYTTCDVSGVGGFVGGVAGMNFEGVVQNCYATGNVVGHSRVGGVVGNTGPNSIIKNCVALNKEVNSTQNNNTLIGRVVGDFWISTLTNNFALVNMTSNVIFQTSGNRGGIDITATQAKTASFWTTTTPNWTGWDTTIWDISDGRLPILRNVGGNQTTNNPPEHLR